jgi:hypothetical protein
MEGSQKSQRRHDEPRALLPNPLRQVLPPELPVLRELGMGVDVDGHDPPAQVPFEGQVVPGRQPDGVQGNGGQPVCAQEPVSDLARGEGSRQGG